MPPKVVPSLGFTPEFAPKFSLNVYGMNAWDSHLRLKASGVEVLRELLDANGLRQKDVAGDLGGESIVSLILKKKRQWNRQQMEKLSLGFNVSPAVFF